jgi:hypothetical protein
MRKAWNFKDLTGQKFGRLIVIKRGENYVSPKGYITSRWWCQCDCGNPELVLVSRNNLKNGATKSCGCYKSERASLTHKKYNSYNLSGEYGIGYTYNQDSFGRNEFYFDLEDYEIIKDFCWMFCDDYVVASDNKNNIMIQLHRIVMQIDGKEIIDHIHGKTTRNDNRKSNLRMANKSQNAMNKDIRNDNTSGVTGVYWSKKAGKWAADIQKDGKRKYLGVFDNFDDAVAARKAAEKEYFGEYAYDYSQAIGF